MKTFVHLIIMLMIAGVQADAQKRAFTIEDLYKVKYVGSPNVSPSGEKTAFTVSESDLKEGKSTTRIYILDNNEMDIKKLETGTEKSDEGIFWGSDDSKLYFVSSQQLYSYSFEDEEAEKITDFYSGVSDPVLSPNGKYLLFTADVYPECGADGECNKRLDESMENGPIKAYIADSLMFRHWTEYRGVKETHLILFNLEDEEYRDLAHNEWASSNYMLGGSLKYAFSPDSREICYTAKTGKDLASSINTDLYLQEVDGGERKNITADNPAWDGAPVYSPDGSFIAFKRQDMPDFEADKYEIALYDRKTGKTVNMTDDFDYTVSEMVWDDKSGNIYFDADYQGYSPLYRMGIRDQKTETVMDSVSITGFSINNKTRVVYYTSSSVGKPVELYKFDMKNGTRTEITELNKELLAEVDVRPAEQMWIEGADGKKVHVFLVKPHGFDPNKKYPLVLNVHGGPQGQWMDSFRGDWQVYPGAGYVVAFPNPHGSTGYGSKYTEAISGDWGGKVYEDLMKVTDKLEKLPYVDAERIGAMGWSYGGYMMNWFQAKTNRYKCLASMMGIFDLESMWGATEELWFVNWDLKGKPWDSEVYEKWSPSNYVKDFKTPALIIAGEKDYRVPYTQSVQYFTTLQVLGIDSRLVIFPNDGHWPSSVKQMPLYYNVHLEWFNKYLGGEPAPYKSEDMIKNVYLNEK